MTLSELPCKFVGCPFACAVRLYDDKSISRKTLVPRCAYDELIRLKIRPANLVAKRLTVILKMRVINIYIIAAVYFLPLARAAAACAITSRIVNETWPIMIITMENTGDGKIDIEYPALKYGSLELSIVRANGMRLMLPIGSEMVVSTIGPRISVPARAVVEFPIGLGDYWKQLSVIAQRSDIFVIWRYVAADGVEATGVERIREKTVGADEQAVWSGKMVAAELEKKLIVATGRYSGIVQTRFDEYMMQIKNRMEELEKEK